jgi:hypothetical protein
MTQQSQTPQEGIADALGGLSEQTRLLVRHEIDAAQQEMWAKAKAAAPALALLAATGVLSLFATAALYRFSLRLLEKRLPRATAALLAASGYGAAAAGAAAASVRALRRLPPPLPTETARQTGAGIAEAAAADR